MTDVPIVGGTPGHGPPMASGMHIVPAVTTVQGLVEAEYIPAIVFVFDLGLDQQVSVAMPLEDPTAAAAKIGELVRSAVSEAVGQAKAERSKATEAARLTVCAGCGMRIFGDLAARGLCGSCAERIDEPEAARG